MQFVKFRSCARAVAAAVFAISLPSLAVSQGQSGPPVRVDTYHYDNLRTGWNSSEQRLTPKTVASHKFKMIASVSLDDLVHAQPLVMTNQRIKGQGFHDTVVYVTTESNTLYAIDGATGAILRKHNFGPPVPFSELPDGCVNNGPNVGITSTPAIIQYAEKMYLMTYTFTNFKPEYQLHAVDLASLEDVLKPVTVTASAKLSDGSVYPFDPHVTRQRPALLASNGTIYAGFGSFCDAAYDVSRGWMLGFNAGDLSPLPANELTNSRARSPNKFFLTAVWMSGAGPAASLNGDVFFVTGNSDFSGTSFNPKTNIEESVAQFTDDLMTLEGLFTPVGRGVGWPALDKVDADFGSGGVLLLPAQKGAPSNLAVALGKSGEMYLLNADNLNNGAHGNAKAYDIVNAGACWCAESYFQGADGIGRVVSSGNNVVRVWKVKTGAKPRLQKEVETAKVQNGQDPGVFTVVTSNNRNAGSAIVWAVGRPVDFENGKFPLYAFDATTGKTLFSGDAGVWPFPGNNATVIPVVANGHAYVASDKLLTIFGLSDAPAALLPHVAAPELRVALQPGEHEIFGTVHAIDGSKLTVQKRDGSQLIVDVSRARARHSEAQPSVGNAVLARGRYNGAGVLEAAVLQHAKNNPAMWYPDR